MIGLEDFMEFSRSDAAETLPPPDPDAGREWWALRGVDSAALEQWCAVNGGHDVTKILPDCVREHGEKMPLAQILSAFAAATYEYAFTAGFLMREKVMMQA